MSTKKKVLAGLTAAAIVLVGSASSGTTADATPTPGKDLIGQGRITDNGVIKGANVIAMAFPSRATMKESSPSAPAAPVLLGEGTTNGSGTYRITADLATVPPAYREADGGIQIQLLVESSSKYTMWMYTIYPKTAKAQPGLQRAVAAADAVAADAPTTNFDLGTEEAWDPHESPRIDAADASGRRVTSHVKVDVTRSQPMYAAARAQLNAAKQKGAVNHAVALPSGCAWVNNKVYRYNVREWFAQVNSASGIPVRVQEGTTNLTTHTLGIAYTSNAGGTYRASGTSSISANTGSTSVMTNVINSWVANRVNYAQYRGWCYNNGTIPNGATNIYMWVPTGFYDILSSDLSYTVSNEAYCSAKLKGQTLTTTSSRNATYTSAVALGFFNASAQSGYGTSVQLQYYFSRNGSICFNTPTGLTGASHLSAK